MKKNIEGERVEKIALQKADRMWQVGRQGLVLLRKYFQFQHFLFKIFREIVVIYHTVDSGNK